MPPKKADKKSDKGQQKAAEKMKQKIAEDKTFGLKNKNKSKSVQKYIKGIQQAAKGQHNVSEQALREREHQQKEEKKKQAQQVMLMASLFKGTENIKKISEEASAVAKSDPKSIKAEQQIDLYVDLRDAKRADSSGGAYVPPTDIVCKHFLEAIQRGLHGYFWKCPNRGDECMYRHCLPAGFVLEDLIGADGNPEDNDADEEESLEAKLECERAALASKEDLTAVTLETFTAWKVQQEQVRLSKVEAARAAEAKRTGTRGLNVLSGRDLFTYDPALFVDDTAAAEEFDYAEDEDHWNQIVNENQTALDQANLSAVGDNVAHSEKSETDEENNSSEDETNKDDQSDTRYSPLDDAAGTSSSSSSSSAEKGKSSSLACRGKSSSSNSGPYSGNVSCSSSSSVPKQQQCANKSSPCS